MARRFALALAAALSLGVAAAAEPGPAVAATPPQPAWSALDKEQQAILAPLADEWDRMENYRRKKWLGIAQRYRAMPPADQQRLQERMRTWAALTPEQRLAARQKYREIKKMDPEKRAAMKEKWRQYNALPEEEKRRLRAERPAQGKPSESTTTGADRR